MMKWFWTFFCALFIYNFVYDTVLLFKTNVLEHTESNTASSKPSSQRKSVLDIIILLFAVAFAIAFVLIVIWNKVFPPIIYFVLLLIPSLFNILSNAILASNTLKTVVIGENSDRELTLKEKYSIDLIACAVLYVATSFPIEKFTLWIKMLPLDQLGLETILSLYILFVSFGVSFIVIVQLIIPFRHLKNVCSLYARRVGKVWNKWIEFFSKRYENSNVSAKNTKESIGKYNRTNGILKISQLLVIPGAFIVDIVIGFFRLLFSVVVCFFLQALLIFSALVGKIFLCVINFVTSIPGRKVIKDTFRLSAIIAVLVVVIANRLSIITEVDEKFIGISEFIASAVVIPIIFEWISSGKERKENKECQIQQSEASKPEKNQDL